MLYQLMYKDEVVLEFDSATPNIHEVVNNIFLPIGIQNGMTLESWLRQRRADKSRVSIRKLFATLKMNFGDDQYISQFRRPTDFWWVRKKGSSEIFATNIENLHLITLNLESVVPSSPRNFEVTNIGSYEKGWRSNYLLKSGTLDEIFSEMLYARISADYMPTARYTYEPINDRHFVSSPNFVNQANGEYLVLADEWTGTGPEEDFSEWFEKFNHLLQAEEIEQFMHMHFLDVILNNFDRHCQNFGFVYYGGTRRNVAPNFDFNLSIIGYNGLKGLGQNEIPVASYFELFDTVPAHLKQIPNKSVLLAYMSEICSELGLDVEPYLPIADWIINRWEQLI